MRVRNFFGASVLLLAAPLANATPFSFGCTDCPLDVGPGAGTVTTSTISVGAGGSILDLNVFISIAHTFSADLDIFIIHQLTGTTVELASDLGGSEDDAYLNTTFDDSAATAIADATPPFNGTFSPIGMLSDFDGELLSGDWTLSITDDFDLDGGQLLDWSIFGETDMASVPEPEIATLMVLGLLGLGLARRRRRSV